MNRDGDSREETDYIIRVFQKSKVVKNVMRWVLVSIKKICI